MDFRALAVHYGLRALLDGTIAALEPRVAALVHVEGFGPAVEEVQRAIVALHAANQRLIECARGVFLR